MPYLPSPAHLVRQRDMFSTTPSDRLWRVACQEIAVLVNAFEETRRAMEPLKDEEARITARIQNPLSLRSRHFRADIYPRLVQQLSVVKRRLIAPRHDKYMLCRAVASLVRGEDYDALCGLEGGSDPRMDDPKFSALRRLSP